MALQSFKGGIWWPAPLYTSSGATLPITGTSQLNVAGEKHAFIFQAPATDSLIEVDYYVSAVGSSGDLDVRIETIDATTGNPSGTLVGTNTNLSATISTTGAKTAVLTASASLTRGTYYAIVFSRTSGDITLAATNIQTNAFSTYTTLLSYSRYHNGTSWQSRSTSASYQYSLGVAPKFSTGGYLHIEGCAPVQTLTNVDFNNTSSDRERGIRFIPRGPVRVEGWYARANISSGNADVVLADSGGTALATYTGDKDYGSAYGSGYAHQVQGLFAASVDLTAGSTYYLTIKPTSATNVRVVDLLLMDTGEANQMSCMAGGTDVVLVTRNSGGAYTVDTTKRPLSMGLIISAVDDATGGGGGLAANPIRGFVA